MFLHRDDELSNAPAAAWHAASSCVTTGLEKDLTSAFSEILRGQFFSWDDTGEMASSSCAHHRLSVVRRGARAIWTIRGSSVGAVLVVLSWFTAVAAATKTHEARVTSEAWSEAQAGRVRFWRRPHEYPRRKHT